MTGLTKPQWEGKFDSLLFLFPVVWVGLRRIGSFMNPNTSLQS